MLSEGGTVSETSVTHSEKPGACGRGGGSSRLVPGRNTDDQKGIKTRAGERVVGE